MAYSKFTTLITGYSADPKTQPTFPDRSSCASDAEYSENLYTYKKWREANYKSTKRAGVCKSETVLKVAEKLGITHKLEAEAMSCDGSGKGRHIFQKITI